MGLKGYRLWAMGQLDSTLQSPAAAARLGKPLRGGLHVLPHPRRRSRRRVVALEEQHPPLIGLALFTTTLFCSQNAVRLMTAS
jgi:hypothetical protein